VQRDNDEDDEELEVVADRDRFIEEITKLTAAPDRAAELRRPLDGRL